MPEVNLNAVDAAELAELLQFLNDWLSADSDHVDVFLRAFVGGNGYSLHQLQH